MCLSLTRRLRIGHQARQTPSRKWLMKFAAWISLQRQPGNLDAYIGPPATTLTSAQHLTIRHYLLFLDIPGNIKVTEVIRNL